MYNPFGKDFRDVELSDLEKLKSVAEGWYIEYKRERPNGRRIAASVSSFANSRGGVYFIGIESDPRTNFAVAFDGVTDNPDVIRDSVRGNLQPFPYFETFTVDGGNGRQILMAVVPEGETPPYINSDGRIYRRQAAASDPVYENDRYTIDALYQKAQEFREELEGFRRLDLSFTVGEADVPFLQMFVNPVPFNRSFIDDFFSKDNLRELMSQFNAKYALEEEISGGKVSSSGNIKLDSLTTHHGGISLRYLEGQNLAYNGMTLIIDVFGNFKLLVPLPNYQPPDELPERYLKVLNRSQPESAASISLLSARQIVGAIFGAMTNYVTYIDNKHLNLEGLEVKLRVTNCWRKSLYFDSDRFLAHVEEFGIPICMKSEQDFPSDPIPLKIDELRAKPVTEYLVIFSLVANALGVPSEIATISVLEEMRDNPRTPS